MTWANETKLLTLLLAASGFISWFSINIKLMINGKKMAMNQMKRNIVPWKIKETAHRSLFRVGFV